VTASVVLPVRLGTVVFVSRLLWVSDGVGHPGRHPQVGLLHPGGADLALAMDNKISKSTAYDYVHEGIDTLSGQAPSLSGALLAAKMAGHSHVVIDGTLIETDRCRQPGPTPGVDLFWSGKHDNHGGNVQVITAPDEWPLWTSDVRPGREHDTTALRYHAEILPLLQTWTGEDALTALGDLGYKGEADTANY